MGIWGPSPDSRTMSPPTFSNQSYTQHFNSASLEQHPEGEGLDGPEQPHPHPPLPPPPLPPLPQSLSSSSGAAHGSDSRCFLAHSRSGMSGWAALRKAM